MSMAAIKVGEVSSDKIDPEAYVSVELSTSKSIVQVKRRKIDLEKDDSKTLL